MRTNFSERNNYEHHRNMNDCHDNFTFSFSGITIEMIWCPPGSFIMGSHSDEIGHCNNEFQHRVDFTNGFWISATLVSQKLYDAVMDNNPAFWRWKDLNYPIESISWNNAYKFCEKINRFIVEYYSERIPMDYSIVMPSEAEWEYACRAGTLSTWNNGTSIKVEKHGKYDKNLDICGWYGSNSNGHPHAVGEKEKNSWGIFDMHGNVFEWCRDWYCTYSSCTAINPQGGGQWNRFRLFGKKIVRGGAFMPVYSNIERFIRFLLNISISLTITSVLFLLIYLFNKEISFFIVKYGSINLEKTIWEYIYSVFPYPLSIALACPCIFFLIVVVKYLLTISGIIDPGCFRRSAIFQCRSAYRRKYWKFEKKKYVGFRIALSPVGDVYGHQKNLTGNRGDDMIPVKAEYNDTTILARTKIVILRYLYSFLRDKHK